MLQNNKGIYLLDIDQERPIFRFYLRPWKVEYTIQTNEACKVKQGKLFYNKQQLNCYKDNQLKVFSYTAQLMLRNVSSKKNQIFVIFCLFVILDNAL